jgi:hypothetical protein
MASQQNGAGATRKDEFFALAALVASSYGHFEVMPVGPVFLLLLARQNSVDYQTVPWLA